MTAHTEALTARAAPAPYGFNRWQIGLLIVGAATSACFAAADLGPLSVAVLPFLASAALAMLGQATAWIWLLVAMSGVGLTWAEGSVVLGSWTINTAGLQWGLTFVLGAMLLVLLPRAQLSWPTVFRWYAAFVVLAFIGLLRAPNLFEGVKNAIQYGAPLVFGLVALRVLHDPRRIETMRTAFWIALGISFVVAIASIRWSSFTGDAPGLTGALGNRVYSIFLLPMLALALAAWRRRGPAWMLLVITIVALIAATLSRTVTAVAVVMTAVAFMWDAGWGQRLRGVVVVALLGVLILSFEPLRERFITGEDARRPRQSTVVVTGEGRSAQFNVSGISLSGRGLLWLQTWRHAMESPVIGHGTGGAEAYLGSMQMVSAHPHNDYLRIFHDYGAIGLSLLLAIAAAGLLSLRKLYRKSESLQTRELALAAFLTWLGYLMVAVTDNIVVYVSFFTQNMFLLIAMAHAASVHERAAAHVQQS
ncbi:MAG: O-antigen ligase family protein [Longimicrobiales bacterium]